MEKEQITAAARHLARVINVLNRGGEIPPIPDGITYRDVFIIAKRHSLACALCHAVEDLVKDSDPELVARLRKERDLECAKNLTQTREVSAVTSAFTDAGVRFLPMKGVLFKELSARPEYRTMSDMDIYVGREGIDRATEMLCDMGYTFGHCDDVHNSLFKHIYVNIELHKMLEIGDEGDFSSWTAKPDNEFWYVMSDEDLLAFVISHMYRPHVTGGNAMRSVYDVYLFLEAKRDTLDLERVREVLKERDMLDFFDKTLALAEFWFGSGEADDELLEMEYFTVTGGTYGTVENKVELAMKKKSRLSYLFSRIFLPYSSMKKLYKWLVPLPFLLPFAWVARIFKALFDGRLRRELMAVDAAERRASEKEADTLPPKE